MAGQIIERGKNTYTLRIFMGRDSDTGKRQYHNQTVRGTKKQAQAILSKLLVAKVRMLALSLNPTKSASTAS